MRHTSLVVVLALTVLMLASCATGPGGSAGDEAGCGDCADEIAKIQRQVRELDGVTKVFSVKRYGSSPTNGAGVSVEVEATTGAAPSMADRVAEIVWSSRVQPLDVIDVTVENTAGELVGTGPYDVRDPSPDYESYVEEWGERPVQ